MWTELNFSINGIIARLMCRLLEQNRRSTQGQTIGCWVADHGYFLLFESMLDSVLYARDRYLADGGSGGSHLLFTANSLVSQRVGPSKWAAT
ncbi:Protein arginine N-methyltransferase 3 [Liparis tanakae]|uniref:Protein arginine N-methyltransferase 3 n=1 Tax=Liparis tanakae TaxID=230148 RepID=A0A4Z2EKJ0_9TELE|nr:Protein arginine N-methyltransferase 3 [Liparis tanakae]